MVGEPAAVVAVMDQFARAGDSPGWINVGPSLSDEQAAQVPARSGAAAWFSGRGPTVAMATWIPGVTAGKPRPAQVGVEHGTGPNALPRLAEGGMALPSRWAKRQDHARHGIVVDVPVDADHAEVVAWLVGAVTALTPQFELGPRWAAMVHRSV